MQRTSVGHGAFVIGSRRGTSSHQYNPMMILAEKETTEDAGTCYGMSFVYSGGFKAEVEKDQFGQGQAVLDAVETGGQDQADDQIRVARGVGPAQLNAAVLAVGAGQTHELAAVLAAPAHVQRGLVCAQPRVGVGHRVAERRQLPRVGQDARHKMSGLAVGRKGTVKQVLAVPQQRDIDMQTAARLVGQRLDRKSTRLNSSH